MTQPTSILILGAGELGSEVIKSLVSHPSRNDTQISLLLRPSTISTTDPAKRAELQYYKDAHITLLPGDIATDSLTTLASTFAPFHTIISCTGMLLPPGTQLKLSRAILAANVPRYFPWQFGLDYDAIGRASPQPLFSEQLDVRDLLRNQSATKWVVVSTGMFISFLFEPAFGVVDLVDGEVMALGGWERELTVTDVGDIGRVVAELALVDVAEEGVVRVVGDTVSMARLAGVVEGLLSREVERSVKSVEVLEEEVRQAPGDVMGRYRAVFARGVGVAWEKGESYNARKGMEMVGVEEWARENVVVPGPGG